jgi:hypothetical protein
MLEIRVNPSSFGILERNSGRFKKRLRAASNKGVYKAAVSLYYSVRENISRTDYSPSQLKDLDHPYAKRHGRILSGRLGGAFLKKPFMIHTRSGRLIKDLSIGFDRRKAVSSVFFSENVFYTEIIVSGTKTSPTIPRNVISGTANLKSVQSNIYKIIRKELKDVIKSYGSI